MVKRIDRSPQHISGLLAAYQTRLRPPQKTVERACCQAIYEVVGIEVTEAQVAYTVATKTIVLHLPSVLKHHIRRQQAEIEGVLVRVLGSAQAPTLFL